MSVVSRLRCPDCNRLIPPRSSFEWHKRVGCKVRPTPPSPPPAPSRWVRKPCPDCDGLLDLYHPDRPSVYLCVNPAHKTPDRPGIYWVLLRDDGRLEHVEHAW